MFVHKKMKLKMKDKKSQGDGSFAMIVHSL